MSIIELTAKIVCAQPQPMSTDEIVETIKTIHATLRDLEAQVVASAASAASAAPAAPMDSIRNHEIICLECGGSFKLLSSRHIAIHDLTPRAYKAKHGIPLTQALSARSLSRKRSAQAKEAGMGAALAQWRANKRQSA